MKPDPDKAEKEAKWIAWLTAFDRTATNHEVRAVVLKQKVEEEKKVSCK